MLHKIVSHRSNTRFNFLCCFSNKTQPENDYKIPSSDVCAPLDPRIARILLDPRITPTFRGDYIEANAVHNLEGNNGAPLLILLLKVTDQLSEPDRKSLLIMTIDQLRDQIDWTLTIRDVSRYPLFSHVVELVKKDPIFLGLLTKIIPQAIQNFEAMDSNSGPAMMVHDLLNKMDISDKRRADIIIFVINHFGEKLDAAQVVNQKILIKAIGMSKSTQSFKIELILASLPALIKHSEKLHQSVLRGLEVIVSHIDLMLTLSEEKIDIIDGLHHVHINTHNQQSPYMAGVLKSSVFNWRMDAPPEHLRVPITPFNSEVHNHFETDPTTHSLEADLFYDKEKFLRSLERACEKFERFLSPALKESLAQFRIPHEQQGCELWTPNGPLFYPIPSFPFSQKEYQEAYALIREGLLEWNRYFCAKGGKIVGFSGYIDQKVANEIVRSGNIMVEAGWSNGFVTHGVATHLVDALMLGDELRPLLKTLIETSTWNSTLDSSARVLYPIHSAYLLNAVLLQTPGTLGNFIRLLHHYTIHSLALNKQISYQETMEHEINSHSTINTFKLNKDAAHPFFMPPTGTIYVLNHNPSATSLWIPRSALPSRMISAV